MAKLKGGFSLEALLLLAAYASVIVLFAGVERGFSERFSQEALEAANRSELSNTCLALDWVSFAGEYSESTLSRNTTGYTAGGNTLSMPGGPSVNCSTTLRSIGGTIHINTWTGIRG